VIEIELATEQREAFSRAQAQAREKEEEQGRKR
jgi:hypothetical protein